MKNFFIPLALGILVHASSHAFTGSSRIKIREIDHRIIRVQLNQGPTSQPAEAIHLDRIAPGTHHVNVWVKNGHRRTGGFALAYSGPMHVPANSDIKTILHRNGQLKVFEVLPLFREPVVSYQPAPGGHCGTPIQFGMDDGAFHHLLAAMNYSPFDQTRLQIARQAITAYGSIRTDQVELLLGRLSFESSMLTLAKHAYVYTVDHDNYYRLFPLFRFNSSVHELSSFMAGSGV